MTVLRSGSALRVVLAVAALVVISSLLYVWRRPTGSTASTRPITVAQFGDFFLYLPLYVAKDQGFFAQEGLDVKIVSTGGDDKTWAAVLSGNAQIGIADPTFVAIARSRGQRGKVIASVVNGVPFWGVTRSSSLPESATAADLKGQKVATFPSPSTAFALQEQMFRSAGLSPAIVQSAPGTLLAKVESGAADIALELEPNVSAAAARGYRVIYSMAQEFGDFAITGATVSEEFAAKEPETVQKFVNALHRAHKFIRANPSDSLVIAIARFRELDPAILKAAFERVSAGPTFPSTSVISTEAWDKACQLRIDTKELEVSLAECRESLDISYAQNAESNLK